VLLWLLYLCYYLSHFSKGVSNPFIIIKYLVFQYIFNKIQNNNEYTFNRTKFSRRFLIKYRVMTRNVVGYSRYMSNYEMTVIYNKTLYFIYYNYLQCTKISQTVHTVTMVTINHCKL
jgi:hypothetical protein